MIQILKGLLYILLFHKKGLCQKCFRKLSFDDFERLCCVSEFMFVNEMLEHWYTQTCMKLVKLLE